MVVITWLAIYPPITAVLSIFRAVGDPQAAAAGAAADSRPDGGSRPGDGVLARTPLNRALVRPDALACAPSLSGCPGHARRERSAGPLSSANPTRRSSSSSGYFLTLDMIARISSPRDSIL